MTTNKLCHLPRFAAEHTIKSITRFIHILVRSMEDTPDTANTFLYPIVPMTALSDNVIYLAKGFQPQEKTPF